MTTTSKTIIGFLNTTLKGIEITTGEHASVKSAELISKGILLSIQKKSIADEFILYVKENYQINLSY